MDNKKHPSTRVNALLTEYEIGHNHSWKFDTSIWQTAAVFIPTSLAGFVFIAQIDEFSPARFFNVASIGLGSIIMLIGWVKLVNRWERLKRVIYVRLREIEEELDLWHNRYLEHIHVTRELGEHDSTSHERKKRRQYQDLDSVSKNISKIDTTRLMKIIAIGISITWIILISVEFVFTFLVSLP